MQEGKVCRSYDCGAMRLRTLRILDCEGYGLTRDDVVMIAVCIFTSKIGILRLHIETDRTMDEERMSISTER